MNRFRASPSRSSSGNDYDAIIIGGGPAGSLVAALLAERGRIVLLVEKSRFPRAKVCGGCLGSVGLESLATAGLSLDYLCVPSEPLDELTILRNRRSVELPLKGRRSIDRAVLDDRLLSRAIEAGVEVMMGHSAKVRGGSGDARTDDALTVVVADSDRQAIDIRCRVVIVAAGLGASSVLPRDERLPVIHASASRIGAGTQVADPHGLYPRGRITMAVGERGQGYVGVVRLPDGRLDVAAALNPARMTDGPGVLAETILHQSGAPTPVDIARADWSTTPRLTQRPAARGVKRVFLLGDCAGYVEPFTGEGIGWALRGAQALAPIASRAIEDWDESVLPSWSRVYERAVGRQQQRCRMLCRVLGGGAMTALTVKALRAAPWVAKPFLRGVDPPTRAAV